MRSLIRLACACGAVALLLYAVGGCSSSQKTPAQQTADFDALVGRANVVRDRFSRNHPAADDYLNNSAGYAIYPKVAKGAFIIGGGWGDGILFVGGAPAGRTTITQGSIGLQIGGQSFSEIIFFEDDASVSRFKGGNWSLTAAASAVVAGEGATAQARYTEGVAVFVMNESGLMAQASVGGQRFTFTPQP
ncbi:MAG: lipid-binding SYLF domain-containing protein [Planctomycetota bacterium]|jgi:lipid-binding SYLF domain-containing protein